MKKLDNAQIDFINDFTYKLTNYFYKYSDTYCLEYTRNEARQEIEQEIKQAINGEKYKYLILSILYSIQELENINNLEEAKILTTMLFKISLF